MNLIRIASLIGVAAISLGLSGCASIFGGTTQAINISTPPTEAANCTLQNKEGSWMVTSPGMVTVKKSKTNVAIHCTKAGFSDGEAIADSGFEPWTLGNILIGGLIGLGVDWATGGIHKYPTNVQVQMSPNGRAAAPPPAADGPNVAANRAPGS